MMLTNLRAEMTRGHIKDDDIATLLGVSTRTVRNRISGITDFGYREAVTTRDAYFPGMKLEYLFTNEDQSKSA